MIKLGNISQAMIGMLLMGVTVSSIAEDKNNDTIAIDMSELSTTKEEVAVLQVLSEICPPMLNKSQQTGFNTAYNVELKKLMPTIRDPRLAVQYLSSQQDYKQILNETRQWTLSYPKAENLELCKDLANSN
jgi:hypothetical protein